MSADRGPLKRALLAFAWILLLFVVFILLTTWAFWLEQKVSKHNDLSPEEKERDIDFVVTWVNSNDPEWVEKKEWYSGINRDERNDARRFGDGQVTNLEIETSVRSILKYAPWCHRVWIATDDQVPDFVSHLSVQDRAKVRVIFHRNFFLQPEILPTFNSHTIEANLYNIPGLANRFIYMNDDMFFSNYVSPEHFFQGDMPLYRSTYLLNVRGMPTLGKIIMKVSPSSRVYLTASANLSDYGNRMFIWRYKHHAVPLHRSFFTKGHLTRTGYPTSCLCRGRFRDKLDVPPIHCAAIHAIKNKLANLYTGETYQIYYGEKLKDHIDLSEYHECCINNVATVEEALDLQRRALRNPEQPFTRAR